MKVLFISPMYNAESHLDELISSLKEQRNESWEHVIIDDMSTDGSYEKAVNMTKDDKRFRIVKNTTKKWALENIVSVAREYEKDPNTIIAVIDADDTLCNENTVDIILSAYEDPEVDTAWTQHTWDINTINTSGQLPEKINPYQFPWCTSHLKTWRATTLLGVDNENFKDLDGEWFKRGCDQALYLPLLYISHKRKFIDEVCYMYRFNSKSTISEIQSVSKKMQLDAVRLVRARGFV